MIKNFKDLYALNISEHISKKPTFKKDQSTGKFVKTGVELDYLNWADCLVLLYQNGADQVRYGNCLNHDGHSLFLSCGNLPEVRVFVDIDGDRREFTYPVIDGSADIRMDKIAQSDIHNASQRAFVKCVAVNWGLGLSLWQKEEKERPVQARDDLSVHNIYAIKTRVEQLITAKLQRGMEMDDIVSGVGLSKRDFDKYMTWYTRLGELENRLQSL